MRRTTPSALLAALLLFSLAYARADDARIDRRALVARHNPSFTTIDPYFPSNGSLLLAAALMAGGWDGATGHAPGFPKDGKWVVKVEGIKPLP